MMSKTVRIVFPEWQGGNNPVYYLGSQLLSWLAPKNEKQVEIVVPIEEPKGPENNNHNGVVAQETLKERVMTVTEQIESENPDKIITLGGDCFVSQVPFDYLHGKYKEDLGIIWIDAHPDVSTPAIFNHEHAMVLGNLLGAGDAVLASKVKHPFDSNAVLYVGLQQPNRFEESILDELGIHYQVQADKPLEVPKIQQWIKENNFNKVVIHLDLDVLDPKEFRMLYFAEPLKEDFGAEGGRMSLVQLSEIMAGISAASEIVGLTIAELLPWDVRNLRNLLSEFDIFK